MKRLWAWLQWIINRPVHKISVREVVLVAAFATALFLSLNFLLLANPDYSTKLKAAKLMAKGINLLREEYQARGLEIDPDIDSKLAGVVGPSSSVIVTVPGGLKDKMLSARQDMAAIIVDLLMQAGVRKGDVVAIGATGSFPALNMATLIAVEALGATPLVISSVGASSWGATNPKFTWLDMEKILADNKIIHERSIAASLGGRDDRGIGMTGEGPQLAREAIDRNGIEYLSHAGGVEEAVKKRVELYQGKAGGPVKVYVNVGGGIVSLGLVEERQLPPGLTLPSKKDILGSRSAGLYYLSRNVPVINLDGIGSIASKYGITNSGGATGTGKAGLYYKGNALRVAAGAALTLLLISLYLVGTGKLDRWIHPKDWTV